MKDQKYEGFKAGIEIHQRLNTHKLFCNCESRISESKPKKIIERFLRPVAGETGEIDRAALFESFRNRKFRYLCYPDETCLVEMDEEPPHDVNYEALKIAIQVAKMLHCDIPDEIQFMRKIVIDGSNTSGFQRTAIIGMNGFLKTSQGIVRITNVSLEEEAAQIIEKRGDTVTYGLDRLGIPLVEIGTAPDLKNPKHVRETAEKIGMLLRSTGRVQRGIGTIRQDVNISIPGGARVEIKGVQDLRNMEKIVEGEVERQRNLLRIMDVLKGRTIGSEGPVDVTHIFRNTKNKMILKSIKRGEIVLSFKLIGFSGVLKEKISFEKTFGKELADYAKSYGIGGFIHSDEDLGKYDLEKEFSELENILNKKEQDIIGIIVGKPKIVKKACLEIINRAKISKTTVPEETRAINVDFTTSYLRPLPGRARMYPETDIRPIFVTNNLKRIKIPESLEKKKEKFIKLGLSEEMSKQMIRSEYLPIFEKFLNSRSDIKKMASILLFDIKDLKREGVDVDKIKDEELEKMLKNLRKIPKESIKRILIDLSGGKSFEESFGSLESIDEKELEKIINKHLNIDLVKKEGIRSFKKLMGPIMSDVKGKIDGKIVAKVLKKKIEEILKTKDK